MKLTTNTYEVMTKYLFFSNFARDLGMSAIFSGILFGSGYYIMYNYDDLTKLFVVQDVTEDKDNSNEDEDDLSPKPLAITPEQEQKEPEKKSWFWFM